MSAELLLQGAPVVNASDEKSARACSSGSLVLKIAQLGYNILRSVNRVHLLNRPISLLVALQCLILPYYQSNMGPGLLRLLI